MKKKILIIDDSQDILEITKFLLKEKGYEVVASLTTHILSDLSRINPDIILLDEYLDGTRGHEECIVIKTTENTKHIPIVIFSGAFDIEKIAGECLANGFIAKPFVLDHFYKIVESQLLPTTHTNTHITSK